MGKGLAVFVFVLSLACMPVFGVPGNGKGGGKPGGGTTDPVVDYTLSVDALISAVGTEVVLEVGSDDGSPPPLIADKVQVKVIDPATGLAVYVENHRSVPLTDGVVTFAVSVLSQGQPVEASVTVRSGGKNVVLRANCLALFRPDLTVSEVILPAVVKAGNLARIEAVVSEVMGDLGASFDIDLVVSGSVVETASGILLDPAGAVSVVFGYTPSEPGTFPASVVIRDAVPGEYDESNNAYPFDLVVLPNLEPAYYALKFADLDFRRVTQYFDTGDFRVEDGLRQSFSLEIHSSGTTPTWPIDLGVSVRDTAGDLLTLQLSGLAPASGTLYTETLPGGITLTVSQPETGGVNVLISRAASDYVVQVLDSGYSLISSSVSQDGDFWSVTGGIEADIVVEGANGAGYGGGTCFCPLESVFSLLQSMGSGVFLSDQFQGWRAEGYGETIP